MLFSEDAAYEAFAKITNPEVDDSYTHVEAKNEGEDDIEAYYKKTGSAQFDFKDGYIELPLFSGYWKYKSTGSNWTKFDDMSLALPKTGGDELFIICNRDYLMSQFGSNFAYICSMDDAVSEEYGITLEEFLEDMLGFIGIEIVRQSLVPTGDDIIKIDEKSYYKLKNDDGLFKQFSDGELYGPVYTKFTLGSNKKFIEDPSMLYLVMGDDEGIVTQSIPDSITGSYADACKQYGDLEQLFGCRFVKKSTPTPTPKPKDDDEKDEPAKEASGQDKGPAPVENSSQMKGTGSQAGWKSIEAAISPKNEVNGTYTIWGSKTMDVPNYVMSKMQNTGVHIANFAMTPKTMFSMWPSLNREGFTLSIDARCWNDNLKYHDFAPSVPAATILAKGGNVLSDVLTVRCSNKDVSKIAVITNNKLLTNAVSATLYVYNPGNNTLVPYKTARYGQNMSVQFVVPCVSATYVCIEN